MKKISLLLIVLMISALSSFAQQDSGYVTGTDTEKLIDKYSSKLEAGMTALAKTLEQPAEHIYTLLVKQQRVKAKAWLFVLIALATCTLLMWVILVLSVDQDWIAIPTILTIICFIVIGSAMTTILTGFYNPEYGAIKEIARFLK